MVLKSVSKSKKIVSTDHKAEPLIKNDSSSDLYENLANLKQDCSNLIDSSSKAFNNLQDFGSNSLKFFKNGLNGIENISKVSVPVIQTSVLAFGVMSVIAPAALLPTAGIVGKTLTLMMSYPLTTISSAMIGSACVEDYKNAKEIINSGIEFTGNSIKASYFGSKLLYDFSKSLYIGSTKIGAKIGNFISDTYETASSKLAEYLASSNAKIANEDLLDPISTIPTDLDEIMEDFHELQSHSDELFAALNFIMHITDFIE
jgi:hypothetical protein